MRLIRKPALEEKVGYTERHIRDMEARGAFPKRLRPDPNGSSVAWIEEEIDEWIAARAAEREAA
ncbi:MULTISPECIES: AlpA family phage regulatory protein [unclassified Sphingomonas]|uniref:AlpA family phage regulatory protein n=1 Tax=unclassified Sphingomonas TaxID=196159 RepID=UPI000BC4DFCD|nr:MAG: hypothetical protein B7Y98_06190 [Sphingomonas sp. 32-62-10]